MGARSKQKEKKGNLIEAKMKSSDPLLQGAKRMRSYFDYVLADNSSHEECKSKSNSSSYKSDKKIRFLDVKVLVSFFEQNFLCVLLLALDKESLKLFVHLLLHC